MNDSMSVALERFDSAELFRIDRETTPIALVGEGLEAIATRQNTGWALRVIDAGRLGFASTNDSRSSEALIEAARAAARFGDAADFSFASSMSDDPLTLHDPRLEDLSLEDLVELGETSHQRLRALAPDAEIRIDVERRLDRISIQTTEGLQAEERRSSLGLSVGVVRAKKDDIFTVSRAVALRHLDEPRIEAMVRTLAATLGRGERMAPAPSGELPVVFAPSAVVAFLLPILSGCNGRNVHLGMSPLAGRLGEPVFDPRFTLYDDGRAADGMWGGSFDDEGTPTRTTVLVDEGALKTFLYDRRTGRDAGAESTGNGRKEGRWYEPSEFRIPPGPSFSNLRILPGDRPADGLVGEIDRGLWIEEVLGLGQGNLSSGDFSNTVGVGFLIEHGEVVGRVKNVMIAGNAYRLLKDHLIGIADTPEWTFGRLCSPAIAVSGVSVSSKG